MRRIVTLLTDFGTADAYVAALKGVLLSLAPEALPVDVSHEVAPGDIEGAAFLLAAALPAFPPAAIHVAVVDPGVGSARRILAIETEHGTVLAPDNGLGTHLFPGSARVLMVDRPDLYRVAPGATFHGRDRFAPLAAFLANGGEPASLGPAVADPVRLPIPPPHREGDELHGRVAHIDRYGNLVTDLPTAWLEGELIEARIGNHFTNRFATHYAALAPIEAAVIPGSLGTLELAVRDGSLAERWGVERGAGVVVLVE